MESNSIFSSNYHNRNLLGTRDATSSCTAVAHLWPSLNYPEYEIPVCPLRPHGRESVVIPPFPVVHIRVVELVDVTAPRLAIFPFTGMESLDLTTRQSEGRTSNDGHLTSGQRTWGLRQEQHRIRNLISYTVAILEWSSWLGHLASCSENLLVNDVS